MKNATLMTVLGLAILVGGTAGSWAASDRGAGPRHSFEDLDANGDGQLTQAELDGHMQARFAQADTNGDGRLSKDELQARGSSRASKRADKMIERLDANGDGGLSLEEMRQGRGGAMFERADADGDGAISKAEFDEARANAKGHHKRKSTTEQ